MHCYPVVAPVLGQSTEIIIVDNAFSDFSMDAVTSTWPHIQVIKNYLNLGFATASNIGTKAPAGNHFLFLNLDCVLAASAVRRMLETVDSVENVGMVRGVIDTDGTGQGGSRRAVLTPWCSLVRVTGLSRFAGHWPRLFYVFHLHKQPLGAASIEIETISGS